jgi:asparaginyl-tRNA synthetase
MPEYIRVSDISKHVGQDVEIKGWVYNRTDKGKLCFLLIRDGSGFVQCVAFKGDLDGNLFDQIMRLPQESSRVRCAKTSARPESPAGTRWASRI